MSRKNKKTSRTYSKYHMFCPACESKMIFDKKTNTWKCTSCDYQLSYVAVKEGHLFWYCENCNAFLNMQKNFNVNSKKWICTQCSCENILDTKNAVKLCKSCGSKLPKGYEHKLCLSCKRNKIKKALKIGATVAGILTTTKYFLNSACSDEPADSDHIADEDESDYPTCKTCGAKMTDYDGWAWYTCPKCGDMVRITDDGETFWRDDISGRSSTSGFGKRCENCGESLSGGSYTMPWETGRNYDGYIVCPHCGYANFQYEDDD